MPGVTFMQQTAQNVAFVAVTSLCRQIDFKKLFFPIFSPSNSAKSALEYSEFSRIVTGSFPINLFKFYTPLFE